MSEAPGPAAPFRPDLYVVARFLDRLCEPGASWTKSSLQPAVRLNYDQYRRYLEVLQARGWLEVGPGKARSPAVGITKEGRAARDRLFAWLGDLFGRPPSL
jgi:hypothetical protein